jgi:hypothetical protein
MFRTGQGPDRYAHNCFPQGRFILVDSIRRFEPEAVDQNQGIELDFVSKLQHHLARIGN